MSKQIRSSIPRSKLVLANSSSLKQRFGVSESANKENTALKSRLAKPSAVKPVAKAGESSIKKHADNGRQNRALANSSALKKRFGVSTNTDNTAPKSRLANPSAVKPVSKAGESSIKKHADNGKQNRVLANPSSLKKRFGASDNTEKTAPKSRLAKPLAVKSVPKAGESSVRNHPDDGRQKRQSAYTFEGYTGENSSDSMCAEFADSIRTDLEEDSIDIQSFLDGYDRMRNAHLYEKQSAYTLEGYGGEASKKQETTPADDTFDLSGYLRSHAANNILDMSLPTADVGNFSIELEKEDFVLNDLDKPASESDVINNVDDSVDLEQELAKGPQERLKDVSLSALMDVEIDYSIEFPTGALGRVPHIFVAKYKRDMKRKAALEVKKHANRIRIPTITITAPSDSDNLFEPDVVPREFWFGDILDQSYKTYLLDASLHNWNMRFHLDRFIVEDEVY